MAEFQFKGLVTNPMAKKWKDIEHKSSLPKQDDIENTPLNVKDLKSAVEILKAGKNKSKPTPYNTYVFQTPWTNIALDPIGIQPKHSPQVTKILYKTACGCTREQDVKDSFAYQSIPPVISVPIKTYPTITNPDSYYSFTKREFKFYEIIKDPSGFRIAVYHEVVK